MRCFSRGEVCVPPNVAGFQLPLHRLELAMARIEPVAMADAYYRAFCAVEQPGPEFRAFFLRRL